MEHLSTSSSGLHCGPEGCSIAAHRARKGQAAVAGGEKQIVIEMYSDFICPWCDLGAAELDDLKGKFSFELKHLGIELFPDTPDGGAALDQTPMGAHLPGALKKINAIRPSLGLKLPPVIPNTRNAILAEEAAVAGGKAHEYAQAVWDAIFKDGENVSTEEAIEKIFAKIGLNPDKVMERTRDAQALAKLREREQFARDHNRTDIPNFIVNGKYSLEGYVKASEWAELFERILKESAE
ncbi:MAG: DsbA family protein [Succinivibrio sp.]|jgi:predicted DsbA family dithiol-disulfide isomerase|nr:DsbA family protein [Succinivibrio sp.]